MITINRFTFKIIIDKHFCLYVFIMITIKGLLSKFISINSSIVSHILIYFFKSCLSFTMMDIVAFPSNFVTYPVICESLIHIGLIISLSLYPIKYLNEFLLPYGSFFETNILLTLMFSILFIALFL